MAVARSRIVGNRQWRSAVTNGALLAGVDKRSAIGRRFRDLVTEYAREIGGGEPLNPAEMALVKQAAALTVRAEALQIDILNGSAPNDEHLVRISNTLARILWQLDCTHRQKSKPGRPLSTSTAASVAEHFASRRKALTEGPPEALEVTLATLRLPDDLPPEATIIWAPAAALAALPRSRILNGLPSLPVRRTIGMPSL